MISIKFQVSQGYTVNPCVEGAGQKYRSINRMFLTEDGISVKTWNLNKRLEITSGEKNNLVKILWGAR